MVTPLPRPHDAESMRIVHRVTGPELAPGLDTVLTSTSLRMSRLMDRTDNRRWLERHRRDAAAERLQVAEHDAHPRHRYTPDPDTTAEWLSRHPPHEPVFAYPGWQLDLERQVWADLTAQVPLLFDVRSARLFRGRPGHNWSFGEKPGYCYESYDVDERGSGGPDTRRTFGGPRREPGDGG